MSVRAFTALGAAWLCCAAGCQEFALRLQSPEEVRKHNVDEAIRGEEGHSRLIGDYINVAGLNPIILEGVALVTGLDNTGDDPPASSYRTALLDDMRKRNVEDPNQVLRWPSTTLVLVRAYLPPLIKKGETFDVEVRVPDGSEATSLRGGMMMQCELTEQAYVPGRGVLKGKRLAIAQGPILVSAGEGAAPSDASAVLRGTIPGGAVYAGEDRNLSVYLRSEYRGVRMSARIASRIGQRFHDYDNYGIKRPLAEAKTDSRIQLVVHSRYRDNFPRYLQCIRHIMLSEASVERHLRMQRLKSELFVAPTAAKAALELEAIGTEAVPLLKEGLQAESLEARFHAAQALGYLGHAEAAPVLAEAAAAEPAFRVYAIAALAAIQDAEAAIALRELLHHSSVETRYGAVRALSTLDARDPAIRGEDIGGKFTLRVVDSQAEPVVHLTRRKQAEIVVFGANQQFHTPLVVSAGKRILVKAEPGKNVVTISRFAPGEPVERVEVSPRVADVIRAVSQMQASYPDIVQMLVEADSQHNLPGKIAIDALPRAGLTYQRPAAGEASGGPSAEAQVGDGLAPNLFQAVPASHEAGAAEPDEAAETLTDEEAADVGPVGFMVK
jgi:hypothetical protein